MTDQEFSKEFFNVFNPEPSKYVEHNISGCIRTVKAKLTPELIEASLCKESEKELSYFSKDGKIDYFGLDIDDHDSDGWVNNEPTAILKERYGIAKKIIGQSPSLLFRSPRGIHAYWFLTELVSNSFLLHNLRKLFDGIKHIEILPTNRHSIRMPMPDRFLDDNLEKCIFSGFESLIRYSIETVFKNSFSNEIEDTGITSKHLKPKKMHDVSLSLEQLEKSIMPLKNGNTNSVYIKLVVKYKLKGLDESESLNRFEKLIKNSPGYSGNLLNNLESRIKSSYRNLSSIGLIQMKSFTNLYREPLIKKAIEEHISKMGLDVL